ncbi:MAG TPA: ABC transporter ATP-binding protein [Ruminococcaceae bacterium]|jgi:sn-glycerol 3-phosphate transport system ATP-binding protein|nr:ABC transporter ATP-binding protein [Oscillospiraceae bacterium]
MADIEIKNIVKIYGAAKTKRKKKSAGEVIPEGKRAIDDVSVTIPNGSFTVLVGPSGCGKTTMLRMIAGLEDITSGQIRIGEVDITNLEPGDRGLAMVFQNYALYPHMTVRENIEFGLTNARIPKFEIKERTEKALQVVGLSEYERRRPAHLSGGQRQRVALARAIAKMPQCFLMDEPLSNLDAKLRSEMRTELIQLHQSLGSTFIYVTHDQIEAMTMGDNIVVMNEGKIMQQGSPTEIHNNPACVFVAKFIGDPGMNIVDVDHEYSIGFRPRDVIFDCGGECDEGIVIRSRILSFENHGSEYLYLVEFDGKKVFIKELSKTQRAVGDEVVFTLLKENLCFFDKSEMRVRDEKVLERVYGEFKKGWSSL